MNNTNQESTTSQKYIVRAQGAGVFYAEISDRRGDEVDLKNARRIHYWDGATECIGLATSGYSRRGRMTRSVAAMTVLKVLEIIPCTPEAVANLDSKPVWTV